jgi:hypothetical protein
MDASYSKEELGKLVVEQAIKHIESWAAQELKFITYKLKRPICVPIGKNSWLVGHYRITKNKKKLFSVYSGDNLINKFSNKQAAFLFASMDKLQQYELSRRIMNSDKDYSRLSEEIFILLAKQKRYIKTSNFLKLSLINAKLSDIKLKLLCAKKDLEKNLIRAKYVKVWD